MFPFTEWVQMAPTLFSKFIPNILPPAVESELSEYAAQDQKLQRELIQNGFTRQVGFPLMTSPFSQACSLARESVEYHCLRAGAAGSLSGHSQLGAKLEEAVHFCVHFEEWTVRWDKAFFQVRVSHINPETTQKHYCHVFSKSKFSLKVKSLFINVQKFSFPCFWCLCLFF